jgi:CMP-N,N'-diacetyllegionaminic acid synthase
LMQWLIVKLGGGGVVERESTVALIPTRGDSKRVPGKNIRPLAGIPLIAHAVKSALDSALFDHVLVSSDDTEILETAHRWGADVIRRPEQFATDKSLDIEWVTDALNAIDACKRYVNFSILRPTSPFRTATTIQRAFRCWNHALKLGYTSLRAVEPVSQHPGKMWRIHGEELVPLLPQPSPQPWHDSQYPSLPLTYVQNASLEIAAVSTVETTGTISGGRVYPFITIGHEGFDVNSELDWALAELLIQRGEANLSAAQSRPHAAD